MQKTIAILAAGIGSRYGGFKQMDPIGPSGEFIIDYTVYDALRAGFNKVVFIIRHDIAEPFKQSIGQRVAHFLSDPRPPRGNQPKPPPVRSIKNAANHPARLRCAR